METSKHLIHQKQVTYTLKLEGWTFHLNLFGKMYSEEKLEKNNWGIIDFAKIYNFFLWDQYFRCNSNNQAIGVAT